MCLIIFSLLLGPRFASVVWWIVNPGRWDRAFDDSWIWPVLGLIFLPWTTLMWVLVAPTGDPTGFDWVWLGLAVLGDIASYSGGAYKRQDVPGYPAGY